MAKRDPLEPHLRRHSLSSPAETPPRRRRAAAVALDLAILEAAGRMLGHGFANPVLVQEALTHRSAAAGARRSNERLEFLGDRVLGLAVARLLVERYPLEQEGALGRRLAHLVSQPVLATIAEAAGLPALLAVAPGEARAGVRGRASVIADALEALLGALFLDAGLAPVEAFVRRHFEAAIAADPEPPKDAKTGLQEWGQARGLGLPSYTILSQDGPPHAPCFVIGVQLGAESAEGKGGSRRAAEQAAAAALLGRLHPTAGNSNRI